MPGKRKDSQDSRRRALLEAAADVFAEQGYAGASLDDIVARAGGSKRNIYNHFGGKLGLLGAVISALSDELGLVVEQERAKQNAVETLSRFSSNYLQIIYSPRALSLWRMIIADGHRHTKAAEVFLQRGPLRAQGLLCERLQELEQRGLVRVADTAQSASDFLAMLRGTRHLECLVGLKPALKAAERGRWAKSTTRRFLAQYCT